MNESPGAVLSSAEALLDLLRRATVQICGPDGASVGTGVLIYPNHVLTAAHVVDQAQRQPAVVLADGRRQSIVTIAEMLPWSRVPGVEVWPFPDLAVLKVEGDHLTNQPFVELTEQLPGGELYASGYVTGLQQLDEHSKAIVQDRVRVSFEGPRLEDGTAVLKVSDGLILPGMSGAPLIDVAIGKVVGIVKADRVGVPGGYAVAGSSIRQHLPAYWAAHEVAHAHDPRWRLAVDTGRFASVDSQLIISYLQVLRDDLDDSPLLPEDLTRDQIRQPVRVRPRRIVDARLQSAESPATSQAAGPSPAADVRLGEAFLWDPLRSPWRSLAIVAGPGMGKTWLLAHHISAIAEAELQRLDKDPALFTQARLPLFANASELARRLERVPTSVELVTAALASVVHREITKGLDISTTALLIQMAVEDHRAILCVDGLDEVPADLRPRLTSALALLQPHLAQLVVSGRETARITLEGIFTATDFEEFEIIGFTQGDVRRFVSAWHRHDPLSVDKVSMAIRETPHLRSMVRVPLLLGFVCRLASASGSASLSTTRSGLYRDVALNLLSGHWRDEDRKRSGHDVPMDPMGRLRLLARAVGASVTGWRTRPDEFSRRDIEKRLRADPEYADIEAVAVQRWEVFETTLDRDLPKPPASPVIWEFLHDGFLVPSEAPDGTATLRFTHLVFAELCIAMRLAGLGADEQASQLEVHRWFDEEWSEIIPIACGTASDPRSLLAAVAGIERDPWLCQAQLEASCMAEVPGAASPQAVDDLLARLIISMNSGMRADLARLHSCFSIMIAAGVGNVRSRLVAAIQTGEILREEDRHALVHMLCRAGVAFGVDQCSAILKNRSLPPSVRSKAASALCATDDRSSVQVVVTAYEDDKNGHQYLALALGEGDAEAVEAAVGIVERKDLDQEFRATIAIQLIHMGAGERAASALLESPTTGRASRVRVTVALLLTGNRVDGDEARALVFNPNVTQEDRLELVHALLLRGDFSVMQAAGELIVDSRLDRDRRDALARTVLSTGEDGKAVLINHARAADFDRVSPLVALLALIERRQQAGATIAIDALATGRAPLWMRCDLVTALLHHMPGQVDPDYAVSLLDDRDLRDGELPGRWEAVAAHMLQSGDRRLRAEAGNRVRRVILGADTASEDPHSPPLPQHVNQALLLQQLGNAGGPGVNLLIFIARSPRVAADTRIQAALVVVQHDANRVSDLDPLLDDVSLSAPIRERLVVAFAMLGATHAFERLLSLLPSSEPAYAGLHALLRSDSATIDMIELGVDAASDSLVNLTSADQPTWDLDFRVEAVALVSGASSEAERTLRADWLTDVLRTRTYARLLSLLLVSEKLELLRVGNFQDNTATRDWLATWIPSYREITAEEVTRVRAELDDNPDLWPSVERGMGRFEAVKFVASLLEEWMTLNAAGHWGAGLDLLASNESICRSSLAHDTFALAWESTPEDSWPTMHGHYYLLATARDQGIGAVRRLLSDGTHRLDMTRKHLDAAEKGEALGASALGLLIGPSEVTQFYAAETFALMGQRDLALSLMRQSASTATRKQAYDGRQSLLDFGAAHDLGDDLIEELRAILGEVLTEADEDAEEDGSLA